MEKAKKIVDKTPLASPRSTSPILPDLTGSNIIHIVDDIATDAGTFV